MPRVESISKPKIERRINSTKYIQNLLPPKNSYKMKRSICIFSDPTQLISRKSMQPNHQTKTHRSNLNSNTNLGQSSSYSSSFHPSIGDAHYCEFPPRNEQQPPLNNSTLSMHAPTPRLVNLTSREAIVILFILLGEVFAVSWTIENWFVNHLPRKQERGSR